MDSIKIIGEKENALFNRKEVLVEATFDKAPSRDEVLDIFSKKFSVEKDRIIIENIKGNFGNSLFFISAKIYKSIQDKEKTEPIPKKEKKEKTLKEGGQ